MYFKYDWISNLVLFYSSRNADPT